MNTSVLAIGRPIVIGSPAASIGDTVDQIVVSVGPYMFSNRPDSDRTDLVDERRRQRLAAEHQLLERGERAEPEAVGGDHRRHRRRALEVGHAVPGDLGDEAGVELVVDVGVGRRRALGRRDLLGRRVRRRRWRAGAARRGARGHRARRPRPTPKSMRQAISSTPSVAQLVDLGEAALGCAEQPGRAHVALEGVVHDHGDLVGIELVEVGNRRSRPSSCGRAWRSWSSPTGPC